MALPTILPNQDIPPLEQDPEEDRGPFDPPTAGQRFTLVWYLFFQAILDFVNTPVPVVPGTNAIIAEFTGISPSQPVDVAPTTVGAQLVVFWTQDSGGGAYPLWSVNFAPITSVNVNLDPDKVTIFNFVLRGDLLWWPISYPVIEES